MSHKQYLFHTMGEIHSNEIFVFGQRLFTDILHTYTNIFKQNIWIPINMNSILHEHTTHNVTSKKTNMNPINMNIILFTNMKHTQTHSHIKKQT